MEFISSPLKPGRSLCCLDQYNDEKRCWVTSEGRLGKYIAALASLSSNSPCGSFHPFGRNPSTMCPPCGKTMWKYQVEKWCLKSPTWSTPQLLDSSQHTCQTWVKKALWQNQSQPLSDNCVKILTQNYLTEPSQPPDLWGKNKCYCFPQLLFGDVSYIVKTLLEQVLSTGG
jgi:hypothetical protein